MAKKKDKQTNNSTEDTKRNENCNHPLHISG